VDILQYVDDLTDKDKQVLNDMSGKYGIKSYARLLRVAKKDRDNELRTLYKKQEDGKPKEKLSRNHKRRRRERHQREESQRYRRRHSPTYEPYYGKSSDSDSSDDNASTSDVVIEFGSGNTQDQHDSLQQDKGEKEKER
jgi:hypothetical protein